MKRYATTLLITIIGVLVSIAAFGQVPSEVGGTQDGGEGASAEGEPFQQAVEAFERGNQLFTEERFAEAAVAFREAFSAKPSWKLWYNIGQAEAAAKHYGLGLVAFETYLAEGGDQVPQDRTTEVLAEMKRLRELVGSLEVVGELGCSIFIDGMHRGDTPLAAYIKLAAGTNHDVVVEKDGAVLLHQNIRVSGGDVRTLSVSTPDESIGPAPQATAEKVENDAAPADDSAATVEPQPQLPAAKPQSKGLKVAGFILMGTGIAGLVVGGVTGALALKTAGTLDDKCPNSTCSTTSAVDDMYTSQAYGNVSTVLFAAGGALAVTGVILLVVNKKKQKESMTGLEVTPLVGHASGGLLLKGRF